MLQISEIVKQTEDMFDLFNRHFYNGELARPAITVSPDGGRGAYGWCSINEIWNAEGELYREINLCAEYEDRKNHSETEGRGSGLPHGRGQRGYAVQEH